MAVGAVTRIEPRGEVGIWPDGAAFVEGAYVPIAEAKLPILDWGFIRSDCTYDVVHVWNGRFFRFAFALSRSPSPAARNISRIWSIASSELGPHRLLRAAPSRAEVAG